MDNMIYKYRLAVQFLVNDAVHPQIALNVECV